MPSRTTAPRPLKPRGLSRVEVSVKPHLLLLEPDETIIRLARAIARQAAREDHARALAERQATRD